MRDIANLPSSKKNAIKRVAKQMRDKINEYKRKYAHTTSKCLLILCFIK